MCIFKIILGAGMIVGGILIELTWLAFCFGTVVVGLLLLIFMPGILLAPFNIGFVGGLALMASCKE